jgi:3-oxoacyl-[acyl-carrier-protein] synthase-3
MPQSLKAAITAVDYYLPERLVSNDELAVEFEDWTAEKIESKTGIRSRAVAASDQTASDLAVLAAERLFKRIGGDRCEIDFILLCTQTPDYLLPTTACLVQTRLGLPTTCGALDINLGCSGFVYALGVAKGLIETGQAKNVLLLTADTYSKIIHGRDKSVRTLFGDGAAATLISGVESDTDLMGSFHYGTDGRGGGNLIVPRGGFRAPTDPHAPVVPDDSGNARTENCLYMNGPEIFNFTQKVVPAAIRTILGLAHKTPDEIDVFALHQANRYVLDFLRRKMGIPEEKWPIMMRDCGNTVSSSIPILLTDLHRSGRIHDGATVMLLGFGVGYSWAGAIIRWMGSSDSQLSPNKGQHG